MLVPKVNAEAGSSSSDIKGLERGTVSTCLSNTVKDFEVPEGVFNTTSIGFVSMFFIKFKGS